MRIVNTVVNSDIADMKKDVYIVVDKVLQFRKNARRFFIAAVVISVMLGVAISLYHGSFDGALGWVLGIAAIQLFLFFMYSVCADGGTSITAKGNFICYLGRSNLTSATIQQLSDISSATGMDWFKKFLELPIATERLDYVVLYRVLLSDTPCYIDLVATEDEDTVEEEWVISVTTATGVDEILSPTCIIDMDKYHGDGSDLVLVLKGDKATICYNHFNDLSPANVTYTNS